MKRRLLAYVIFLICGTNVHANQMCYYSFAENSDSYGYDADGKIHYTFTDYQGSVIMVTDSVGNVEQHTDYYPYGTPWSIPSGHRRLHIGKELVDETANYVYEPRNYYSAALLWDSNDAHADSYPSISPYSFCAANPIRNIDPTGRDIICMNTFGGVVIRYITEEYDQIFVRDDNKDEWIKSQQYEYGTITEVGTDGQKLNENNYTLSSICIGYVWRCGGIYTNYTAANAKKSENSRNGDILYR